MQGKNHRDLSGGLRAIRDDIQTALDTLGAINCFYKNRIVDGTNYCYEWPDACCRFLLASVDLMVIAGRIGSDEALMAAAEGRATAATNQPNDGIEF